MKSFLTKVLIFVLIIFTIIEVIVSFYYEDSKFPFFSNSISFNAKAKFILDNQKSYLEAKYFVIGSSMSLNNVDCNRLSDSIEKPIFNLSSWGMHFKDFSDFNIWDTNNVIITNIHFQDFYESRIKKKYKYPFTQSKFINCLNISLDFGTYIKQLDSYKESINDDLNDYYEDLNFSKTGSLIFCEKELFKLSDERWNFIFKIPVQSELNDFINSVSVKSKSVKKIIILFSPGRESIKNKQKINFVNNLSFYLNSLPNVVFFNNFNATGFSDEDFVDHSHFSGQGARKYSQIVASQLKTLNLN